MNDQFRIRLAACALVRTRFVGRASLEALTTVRNPVVFNVEDVEGAALAAVA